MSPLHVLLRHLGRQRIDMLGELFDCGILIDVLHGHRRNFQPLADLGAKASHQQRVRAEVLEEIVFDGHALDLHDLGERVCEHLLGLGVGSDELAARCGEARPLGRGQVLAIRLVVRRHRDRGKLFEIARNHVARQMLAQHLGHFGRGYLRGALLSGVVAHKLDRAGFRLVGIDHGLRDLRHLQQHRLDLLKLDPITADLDLGIDAAVKLELTVVADTAVDRRCDRCASTDCSAGSRSRE